VEAALPPLRVGIVVLLARVSVIWLSPRVSVSMKAAFCPSKVMASAEVNRDRPADTLIRDSGIAK